MIFKVLFVFFIVYFLIFIHEFGHYLAAKRNGVKVEEFSIGFPPRLVSFKKGETKFSFALLPLGGYVKLHGDVADSDDKKIVKSKSFAYKTPWQKIKILLAGVAMNFLVYLVLMSAAFSIGVPKLIQSYDQLINEVNNKNIEISSGLSISSIEENSKASDLFDLNTTVDVVEGNFLLNDELTFNDIAELNDFGVNLNNFVELPALTVLDSRDLFLEGDSVLSVDGQLFSSYEDFLDLVNSHNGTFNFQVLRGSELIDIPFKVDNRSYYVVDVFLDSSAYKSGVKEGFKLLSIDGNDLSKIDNFASFVKDLNKDSIIYSFIDLNDEVNNIKIKPDSNGITGMVLNPVFTTRDLSSKFLLESKFYSVLEIKDVKFSLFESIKKSFIDGINLSINIMKSFVETILNFFTRFEVSEQVGGPVAVFKMSYDYVAIGGTQLMQFVALISLTLAAINILPIPVLDGGRIFIVFIEALIQKQASRKFLNILTLASFGILMFFILIVTFFDIIRL